MQNNIKKIREERGLSQAKLASIMGVDPRYIERYESYADIKIGAALDIATALNCTLKDLFGDERLEFDDREKSINPSELIRFIRLSANVSSQAIAVLLNITETEYRKIENSKDLTIPDTFQLLSAIMAAYQSRQLYQKSRFYTGENSSEEQIIIEAYRHVVPSQKKQLLSIVESFLPEVKKTKTVGKK